MNNYTLFPMVRKTNIFFIVENENTTLTHIPKLKLHDK
jgi:hypothetical protein